MASEPRPTHRGQGGTGAKVRTEEHQRGVRMDIWTTEGLSEREQYSYWRHALCEAFTATLPVVQKDAWHSPFPSRIESRHFGEVTVSSTRSCRQDMIRSAREIDHQPYDCYLAVVPFTESHVWRQAGREMHVQRNALCLIDGMRPYEVTMPNGPWHAVGVHIPRRLLRPLLRQPDNCTAIDLTQTGMGQLAVSLIHGLESCPEDVGDEGRELIAQQLVSLLSVAAGATAEAREQGAPAVRQALHAAIVRHIEARLNDPELCVAQVAAYFRVSPRYLHKLFEPSGMSFAQTLIAQRLQRCARELCAPGMPRPIGEIAFRYGFNDVPHFNRTFRRHFGLSPSEYRTQQAVQRLLPAVAAATPCRAPLARRL